MDVSKAHTIEGTLEDQIVLDEGSLVVQVVEEDLNFINDEVVARTGINLSIAVRGGGVIKVLNIDAVVEDIHV